MINTIIERAINTGLGATVDEVMNLEAHYSTSELQRGAGRIRTAIHGNHIDTCSICNARSGRCSEDCKWCAQSRHYSTGAAEYESINIDEAVDAALTNENAGVRRFSLVTSGRRVTPQHIDHFCDMFRAIHKAAPSLSLCASMGLLGLDELKALSEAGVTRYHCNLETSASYFPSLCSTHTHDEKLHTIAMARQAGMSICSGGIIGMGETMRQRLEMVAEAVAAGADSIPVNILNPIAGTPLGNTPPLSDDDIERTIALMRFVAPKAQIRFAGGRARLNPSTTRRILRGGMSGAMIGDLLTTVGNKVADDFRMFDEMELEY